MKAEIIYSTKMESLTKFKEYDIKTINEIKYVVPKYESNEKSNYERVNFDNYEDNDLPLIDFLNLGKLSLDTPENSDKLLIDFVNKYGLLGLIHDLPINRYYTLDENVVLKEFNNLDKKYNDSIKTMKINEYFMVFFPTYSEEDIKNIINKSNEIITQDGVMEKYIVPALNDLYFKNENYFEPANMIISYAQTMYQALNEARKNEHIDDSIINRIETNHIRENLNYNHLTIYIRSLKDYIDEDFKLYILADKNYLKICKHCGKAFTAKNPKTEYDTFSCKNIENVHRSRARKK